ncbi:MAG: thioredoxin family protein [Myxococcales bacterium]|nr:thioredoxin family protein [Myxococcales bacterium]
MRLLPFARRAFFIVSAALITASALAAPLAGPLPGPVEAPHVTVSLVAERAAASPGEALTLGVHFALDEHWHVYWQNPGDSGEAPKIRWTLPAGFEAGPIEWPAPSPIAVGPLLNYGYEGEVLLPVTVRVPAAAAGEAAIEAKVSWLVCREDCIPGKATFAVTLPVGAGEPDPVWAERFAAARAAAPPPTPALFARANTTLTLRLPALAAPPGATVRFFPRAEGVVPPTAAQVASRPAEGGVTLALPLADTAPATIERLDGLVQLDDDPKQTWAVDAAPGAVTAPVAEVAEVADLAAPREETSLGLALLFALLGGALLNLMPCVFPVLSLKILGFVEHADATQTTVRRQGWLYTAGVMAAFLALAGALIALRAGGEQLGWGFQLQAPGFVAALVVLLFLLALSLGGLFEVGLTLTAVGGRGEWGAFGTGVLATVVATPCTAPFMGPALGFALTRPPVEALAVFAALGAGMALPYLVLSYAPALLRRLPRPGAWMETFKQLMAFPLFATVLWLLDVFLQQAGVAAAGTLLAALLALAFAGWLWGRLQRAGRQGLGWLALVFVAATPGAVLAWQSAATFGAPAEEGLWGEWSPEAVAALRAEGEPVFVNYTAAWCISCKVNEKLVFDRDSVRAAFARHGVTTLLADWTDRDDVIARELARHGREGVPLYLYYPPRAGAAPVVLPSVLTPDMVISALAEGAGTATPEE